MSITNHQCQSLKSINLFEDPYLLLLDVTCCFSIDDDQFEEWFFVYFRIFFFCLEKVIRNPGMHKQFLTQPTTEAMPLTIIDVFSLRATIFARFFGVMSIFTLEETKIIPRFKINRHLGKT
jgi:hypothetical protein